MFLQPMFISIQKTLKTVKTGNSWEFAIDFYLPTIVSIPNRCWFDSFWCSFFLCKFNDAGRSVFVCSFTRSFVRFVFRLCSIKLSFMRTRMLLFYFSGFLGRGSLWFRAKWFLSAFHALNKSKMGALLLLFFPIL